MPLYSSSEYDRASLYIRVFAGEIISAGCLSEIKIMINGRNYRPTGGPWRWFGWSDKRAIPRLFQTSNTKLNVLNFLSLELNFPQSRTYEPIRAGVPQVQLSFSDNAGPSLSLECIQYATPTGIHPSIHQSQRAFDACSDVCRYRYLPHRFRLVMDSPFVTITDPVSRTTHTIRLLSQSSLVNFRCSHWI